MLSLQHTLFVFTAVKPKPWLRQCYYEKANLTGRPGMYVFPKPQTFLKTLRGL